ncbi:hypothetical protein GMST_15550 [Geomonas silvestris]|uniref:Helix-turn-helix domain-containing protein n=1 Tax=Geomonas silvestris TaxID=2740184 RepID=A0A6V8MGW9_9BACT|nr:helix-turn-helix domain-containing protein [Geomonas silvestris]GFO59230.1 hypothetical protein GMST_15550 [Geomonas silvestris]
MKKIKYKTHSKYQYTRLLDQKEVAEMLGVSTKTLECWRWKKIGPEYIKIGRLARYMDSVIMAYIDELAGKEMTVSKQ